MSWVPWLGHKRGLNKHTFAIDKCLNRCTGLGWDSLVMFFSNYKSQTLCPFSNGSCGRVKKHYQVKTVLRYTKTKKQGHYANLSPGPSCPSPE